MNAAALKSRDKKLLEQARASARKKNGQGNPEAQLQKEIIRWWSVAYKGLGVPDEKLLYFSNMHGFGGGQSGAIMGKIRKDMGARKDIPDLFLAMCGSFDRQHCNEVSQRIAYYTIESLGLYIELKDFGKKPTKDQLAFHEVLRGQGYMVKVIDNFTDAENLITGYIKGAL